MRRALYEAKIGKMTVMADLDWFGISKCRFKLWKMDELGGGERGRDEARELSDSRQEVGYDIHGELEVTKWLEKSIRRQ